MAEPGEVEHLLERLVAMADRIDPNYRGMLPSRRTIEARIADLDRTYHVFWRHGTIGELHEGPADRADITITVDSDDLIAIVDGDLELAEAYTTNRVRIRASMTDLLRLRAVL